MRKKVIANLKMNMQIDEIRNYINQLDNYNNQNTEVIICPSYIHIPFFTNKSFAIGSQNISVHTKGPYTSEVSSGQLKELGIKYAILGHSEVRSNFNETTDIINTKIKNCFDDRIIPIVCIGESKKEKMLGQSEQVIRREILDIFKNLNKENLNNLIIAYEPIWAIGTGDIPNIHEMEKTIEYIKNLFYSAYKVDVLVLYGGSVNSKNITQLNKVSNCDGFLIGNASCNIDELIEILNKLNN